MGQTLTIRLKDSEREILERAAREHGSGLSTYVRKLASAEATRLRNEEIRAQGQKVVDYLKTNPAARQELEEYGTPDWDFDSGWKFEGSEWAEYR
ncbi:MAG TPA: DUF1778 domain-containing protein [Chloroflexota bacterium]|nr:DUF1778 domain-containing protein [Chloroflexota bacterium]